MEILIPGCEVEYLNLKPLENVTRLGRANKIQQHLLHYIYLNISRSSVM